MLASSCAMWCDDTRLSEEIIIECHIGSFDQVQIKTRLNHLVRIDLQAAVQRSIHTLPLPGKTLHDDQVKMKILVPQGSHMFLWHNLGLHPPFENWAGCIRRPTSLSWQKS